MALSEEENSKLLQVEQELAADQLLSWLFTAAFPLIRPGRPRPAQRGGCCARARGGDPADPGPSKTGHRKPSTADRGNRRDIKVLRRPAVRAVVLYAGVPLVSGGYVGVDVFSCCRAT